MRKDLGYTQKQVADLLNIDRSTYSYYELGKIKPDIKTIMQLAKVFNVHYSKILEKETIYSCADSNGNEPEIYEKNNKKQHDEKLSIVPSSENLTDTEKNVLLLFRMLSKDAQDETFGFMYEKFKKPK